MEGHGPSREGGGGYLCSVHERTCPRRGGAEEWDARPVPGKRTGESHAGKQACPQLCLVHLLGMAGEGNCSTKCVSLEGPRWLDRKDGSQSLGPMDME